MAPELKTGKLAQIRQMVAMTREADPRYVPVVAVAIVLAVGVAFTVGMLLAGPILGVLLAIPAGLIAFTVVTGRRGQAAAFTKIEGQPGAAYAILQSLRGDWRVTPAVAFNRNQDLVHRVVGRPGVILVAEGSGARARELLSAELRKVRRVIGEAPLHDIVIGEGEGQVPLKRLQVTVMKLPRVLKPKDVNVLDNRLSALGGTAMPLPKGPMPTRVPRSGKIR
ncbi:MAG TPA: DUF4191 domain-containing protein [Mycobacteriales bacterium]|jgi:hypothetical protein|nr:DUF4191 domain-containing protein [Mycobacteriales bacterium]